MTWVCRMMMNTMSVCTTTIHGIVWDDECIVVSSTPLFFLLFIFSANGTRYNAILYLAIRSQRKQKKALVF